MKTYDYLENVKEDVRNYIEENKIVVTSSNREEVEQELNDTLFVNDSVTGNTSGSYTFSTWQAEENLCHNFELLTEALTEFCCDLSYLEKGAEACDVTIHRWHDYYTPIYSLCGMEYYVNSEGIQIIG